MRYQFSVGIMLIACSQCIDAAPIVIKDYGGRDSGVPSEEEVLRAYQQNAQPAPPIDFNPFPIRSKIGPGVLQKPLKLRVPIEKPLFFIGNDPRSRDWVSKNKQYLLSIGATGYATNLQSESELTDIQGLAHPLGIAPMPIDAAAELFGIPVYPVLIFNESAKQ